MSSPFPVATHRLIYAMALGAIVSTSACEVGVGPAYATGAYEEYPPDAYIATTEPVYYEGRPSYYYGNRWYYRDGGRWNHYEHEPPMLYQRRSQAPPMRRRYEAPRGRPQGRPEGRGGERR